MLTSEQAAAIDAILERDGIRLDGKPGPWHTSAFDQRGVTDEMRSIGIVGFAHFPKIRRNSKYEQSLLVVIIDPDDLTRFRITSDLHLRATHLHGKLDWHQMPMWSKDVEGGIVLISRLAEDNPKENKYGVPSRSPEYHRRWTKQNAERVKEHQRRYKAKVRAAVKLLNRGEKDSKSPEMSDMEKKLREIEKNP